MPEQRRERHANKNWTLPTADSGAIESWDFVKIAVLLDIRDELQKLNRLLHCHNFIDIPNILRDIRTATRAKRKYVRKTKV